MQPQFNYQIFEEFPILKTKRLTLRQFMMRDAQAFFDMRVHPAMTRFTQRSPMQKVEEAEKIMEQIIQGYQNKKSIGWVGLLRDGTDLIGSVGYHQIDFNNFRAEIGGELNMKYWGKRIAAEAVEEVVRFGLSEMGLHSVEAKVNPDNRSVIHLLEMLGFEKEAHFKEWGFMKGQFRDLAVYSKLQ